MKRRKVIATVVNPGQCRYYQAGREFSLGGFTPAGLCDSAYAVLSRDAQTMAYGGTLPWQEKGTVQTRCPDPTGATWELRYADRTADSSTSPPHPERSASTQSFVVESCRGEKGGCRCAITGLQTLKAEVESAIRNSGWNGFLSKRVTQPIRPHHRLRVAMAACPNACSRPQIRDVGLIASVRAERICEECSSCGKCADACREEAIVSDGDTPRLDDRLCVGCGQCGLVCPENALRMGELRFRVLVGGQLGRHPSLALELPVTLESHQVGPAIRALVDTVICGARSGETFSRAARRLKNSIEHELSKQNRSDANDRTLK